MAPMWPRGCIGRHFLGLLEVSFDIARIQIRRVKRRVQKLDERVTQADPGICHDIHGHARTLRIGAPGENRQASAVESMRHWGFCVESSGVPSSKEARRYHSLFQP